MHIICNLLLLQLYYTLLIHKEYFNESCVIPVCLIIAWKRGSLTSLKPDNFLPDILTECFSYYQVVGEGVKYYGHVYTSLEVKVQKELLVILWFSNQWHVSSVERGYINIEVLAP